MLHRIVFTGSIVILYITLYTNQYFHGGVWGDLHNKSIKPKIEIEHAKISDNSLSFQVFRVEGVDVYGSFLIGIELTNKNGKSILKLNGEDLADFLQENIVNSYVAKVKPGKHSMIIPLGAKAKISIKNKSLTELPPGNYQLTLTDISGTTWTSNVIK